MRHTEHCTSSGGLYLPAAHVVHSAAAAEETCVELHRAQVDTSLAPDAFENMSIGHGSHSMLPLGLAV